MKVIVLTTDRRAYIDDLDNYKGYEKDHTTLFYSEPEYKLGLFHVVSKPMIENKVAESICRLLKSQDVIYESYPCYGMALLYNDESDMTPEIWKKISDMVSARKNESKLWKIVDKTSNSINILAPCQYQYNLKSARMAHRSRMLRKFPLDNIIPENINHKLLEMIEEVRELAYAIVVEFQRHQEKYKSIDCVIMLSDLGSQIDKVYNLVVDTNEIVYPVVKDKIGHPINIFISKIYDKFVLADDCEIFASNLMDDMLDKQSIWNIKY